MQVILPSLTRISINDVTNGLAQESKYTKGPSSSNQLNFLNKLSQQVQIVDVKTEDSNDDKYIFTAIDWRPTQEQETLLAMFESDQLMLRRKKIGDAQDLDQEKLSQQYRLFVDNPPLWNPKTNKYVYDFKGRVTEASIKNFQLIPEISDKKGMTMRENVLQFGKRGSDEFILDLQFPLSIFQGFGLALSAFDTE
jgi:hypothetical protein